MVHAPLEPQGGVEAVPVPIDELLVREEIANRVREPLGLEGLDTSHATTGTDDGVTRADDRIRRAIDGSRAILQTAREAVVQASESSFLGFGELEVSCEELPDADRETGERDRFDPAEPVHQER